MTIEISLDFGLRAETLGLNVNRSNRGNKRRCVVKSLILGNCIFKGTIRPKCRASAMHNQDGHIFALIVIIVSSRCFLKLFEVKDLVEVFYLLSGSEFRKRNI